jgi:hypothetical protein
VTFSFAAGANALSSSGVTPTSRLAALFFVRIAGAVIEGGQLEDFGTGGRTFIPLSSQPLSLFVSYANTGTVHLNPYGRVNVRPLLFGPSRLLGIDPWAVLPGTTRLYEITINEKLSPGIFTARLDLNRGYGDIIDVRSMRFVVFPTGWTLFLSIIALSVFIYLVIRSLRLSRHFTR